MATSYYVFTMQRMLVVGNNRYFQSRRRRRSIGVATSPRKITAAFRLLWKVHLIILLIWTKQLGFSDKLPKLHGVIWTYGVELLRNHPRDIWVCCTVFQTDIGHRTQNGQP